MTLAWAWRTSKDVEPQLKLRLKFVAAALGASKVSRKVAQATPDSPLGELLGERPETAGFLLWPYQCIAWDADKRFGRIAEHCAAVRRIPGLRLAPDDKVVLADLGHISPDVMLIIDRPPWLTREGHLTLSLFKGDFRAFTISFSLSGHPELELFIGGLQGRQADDVLDLYRDLTKDFEGIRPRDFMLEALRMFAVRIGARRILAVADDQKISRDKYFAGKNAPGLFYDEVWAERGGAKAAPTHFELPLGGSRRALEDVAAKKRSMYRRRYEMLDAIEAGLPADLTVLERRRFEAR